MSEYHHLPELLATLFAAADRLRMTDGEIAETCGVDRVTVSRWRHGHRLPAVSAIQPLADRLRLELRPTRPREK